MTDGATFRLDTIDIASERGWHVEHLRPFDEFTREAVTITVQYSSADDITVLARTRPGHAEEIHADDSRGKNERLRGWLTGTPAAAAAPGQQRKLRLAEFAQKTGDWTRQEFIAAVEGAADRAFLQRVLQLADANDALPPAGPYPRIYFGKRPGGALHVYPFGRSHPPFKLSIKGGRLLVSGCWDIFPEVKKNDGFAELAALLGLDETGTAKRVPVAGLDPDELWAIGENVSRRINA